MRVCVCVRGGRVSCTILGEHVERERVDSLLVDDHERLASLARLGLQTTD